MEQSTEHCARIPPGWEGAFDDHNQWADDALRGTRACTIGGFHTLRPTNYITVLSLAVSVRKWKELSNFNLNRRHEHI